MGYEGEELSKRRDWKKRRNIRRREEVGF